MKRNDLLIGVLGIIVVVSALIGAFTFVGKSITSTGEEEEIVEEELPENFYWSKDDTLLQGHNRAPFGREGTTYKLYEFPVENGSKKVIVTVDGDPGNPRPDGGDRNDLDLYVYGENGNEVGSSATPQITEKVELDERDIKRGGYGTYTVKVDCWSGHNVQYTLQIWVYYNDTTNETGNNETALYTIDIESDCKSCKGSAERALRDK